MPRLKLATVACVLSGLGSGLLSAREIDGSQGPVTQSATASKTIYLPYAQFQIPFHIEQSGTPPAAVHLYVSTDEGTTWQLQGKANPSARQFDFRAAAEGQYLFTVRTVDQAGNTFDSPHPPLRIAVDTTQPQAALQADLDLSGNLIVDIRVQDEHLDLTTATLRIRTDRETEWREVPVHGLSPAGDYFTGQVELILSPCRSAVGVQHSGSGPQ